MSDIEAIQRVIVLVSLNIMALTQNDIAPEFQALIEKWQKKYDEGDVAPEEKALIKKFLGLE